MLRAVLLCTALTILPGWAQAQHWSSHGQEWPQIDCSLSHLVVPGQRLCRQGPLAGVSSAYSNNRCTFEQWYASAPSAASRASVVVFMRAPDTAASCYVNPFSDPDAALRDFDAFRDGGPRTRLGGNEAPYTAGFASKTGQDCGAFIRYGQRWRGGYTYSLRGILCVAKGARLSPGGLEKFIAAIAVKTQ